MKKSWASFLATAIALWLLAHTAAFFCHEFSHSFVAFVLGWKHNPLALNWGPPSSLNLLLQVDIDENVDYKPIFALGHRYQAGFIALSGMALGNAIISLSAGLALFRVATKRGRTTPGVFVYWLVVMSLGNLLSYVPLRVFTSHADMHTVETAFGWTPIALLLILGTPIALGMLWFFMRFQPCALRVLFPESVPRRSVLAVLTSLSFFGWFSLAGISGYGELSHKLSVAFVSVLAPLSICLGLVLVRRNPATYLSH